MDSCLLNFKPWMNCFDFACNNKFEKTSAQRINKYGDRGQPCRNPL